MMDKHIFRKSGMLGVSLFAALQAIPSIANAEVSTNLGVSSNYLFRGVTQTDNSTAVQGGLDYEHASGLYAGVWGSNVDFGDGTSYELDLYAGYAGAINNIGYDVGYIYYAYPDAPGSIDFGEIYGELSYGYLSAGLAYTTNSDASSPGLFVEGDVFYYLAATIPLENDFSAGVTLGYYDFTDDKTASVGEASYGHAAFNLTKEAGAFGSLSMNLEYSDIDAEDALGSVNSNDPKFWLGWNKSF